MRIKFGYLCVFFRIIDIFYGNEFFFFYFVWFLFRLVKVIIFGGILKEVEILVFFLINKGYFVGCERSVNKGFGYLLYF